MADDEVMEIEDTKLMKNYYTDNMDRCTTDECWNSFVSELGKYFKIIKYVKRYNDLSDNGYKTLGGPYYISRWCCPWRIRYLVD